MAEQHVKTAQLWIPGRLPGLNELMAMALRPKYGRRLYAQAKAKHSHEIGLLARAAGIPAFEAAHFKFHWVEPNRRRDKDNVAAGGRKLILDALQECSVLGNDGWKQILSFADTFEVNAANPGVMVVLSSP